MIHSKIITEMETFFCPTSTDENDDIPQTQEPVWILGKKYDAVKELSEIRKKITSKLWFTYRKGFVPIGGFGSNYTSDKGWGCMLRCGQMVLGQALIYLHLGKDWEWTVETKDTKYLKILSCFEDRRAAPYSIHQIAVMGASEGKEVGQWFGPNTIAQVLKKLVAYDEWSKITIHVALDNTLVINDVLTLCRTENGQEVGEEDAMKSTIKWTPLLLLIPLRLGLNEINPIYYYGLKKTFQFPQSLGAIGGKPNHALYFIGCVGNEIIYLDPHTTQRSGNVDKKNNENEIELDTTYHCKYASRISVTEIESSVALCFFCAEEKDFLSLCKLMKEELMQEKQAIFELCEERNPQWSPTEDVAQEALGALQTSVLELENVDRHYDTSDEDFELLG